MTSVGDWYCKNCGYLHSSRVTNAETCDTCHVPVEWHDLEQQSALDALRAENADLRLLVRAWECAFDMEIGDRTQEIMSLLCLVKINNRQLTPDLRAALRKATGEPTDE